MDLVLIGSAVEPCPDSHSLVVATVDDAYISPSVAWIVPLPARANVKPPTPFQQVIMKKRK